MRGLTCALTLLLTANAFAADWISQVVYDDISGNSRNVAAIQLPDGHFFGISQTLGQPEVSVVLGIPKDAGLSMSQELLPVMRVDDRAPMDNNDLITLQELGRSQYQASPDTFYSFFPNADSLAAGTGFLYDLVAGNTLKVRYWTTDGAAHRVEFPLTRSKEAISKALGIQVTTPAVSERNRILNERRIAYMLECGESFSPHIEGATTPNKRLLETCLDIVRSCSEIVSDKPESFDQCFATHADIHETCEAYGSRRSSAAASGTCIEVKLGDAFPDYEPYLLVK